MYRQARPGDFDEIALKMRQQHRLNGSVEKPMRKVESSKMLVNSTEMGTRKRSASRERTERSVHMIKGENGETKVRPRSRSRKVMLLRQIIKRQERLRIDTSRPHEHRFDYNPRETRANFLLLIINRNLTCSRLWTLTKCYHEKESVSQA